MKKPNFDAYNFYLELPQTDYLEDIEIQDEYDEAPHEVQGLSKEQVSKIAQDSLRAAQSDPDPAVEATEDAS